MSHGMDHCQAAENCANKSSEECFDCGYNFLALDKTAPTWYDPLNQKIKHPQQIVWDKSEKKKSAISQRNKKAALKEDKVRRTLNSGRANRDGDLSTDDLALDVKYQSKTESPTIRREEWIKIQEQARASGKEYGVLVVINSLGEPFYVIPEQLFKEKFI